MPRYRFPFAVGVGGENDFRAFLRNRGKLFFDRGLALDENVLGGEVVLDVDRHAAFRKIADVPDTRLHDEVPAEVAGDRARLRRRLDDDEACHGTDPGRDFPPVAVVPVFVFADGFFAGIDPASFTAGFVVVFVVAGFFRAAGLFFFSVAAAESSPDCFGDVVFFAAIR